MNKLFPLLLILSILVGCGKKEKRSVTEIAQEKKRISALLYDKELPPDSIKLLYEESVRDKNLVGQMLFAIEVGKHMRNISQYTDAMLYHQKGLTAALALRDTIVAAQAWNHLGTDNRRIGALAEASDYHYKALALIESFSGKEYKPAIKARSAALNGIGNINLELGYYDEAEKNFLEALQGEKDLDSHLGEAINYANLGRIYRQRKEYDKARTYFLLSLEQNNLAENLMGIGLCSINLGEVDEEKGDYQKALQEYATAYKLMEQLSDRWHWLNSCIPMARINLKQGNERLYQHFISLAEETAKEINSTSHLIEVYNLKYKNLESKKEYKQALEVFRLSKTLSDSMSIAHKVSSIQETRFNYERSKSQKELEEIQQVSKEKQEKTKFILLSTLFALFLSILLTVVLMYAYRQGKKHNKLIKETDRLRSNFFTGITHEFRTPITVIQGLNEKMSSSPDLQTSDRAELHKIIDRQSGHMLNLVNQLLDICKIRSGVSTPEWRNGDVVSFVQILIDSFAPYAQGQDITLELQAESKPIVVDFVPSYLQKIISNLLSNAIKYSFAGGKVVVSLAKTKNEKNLVIRIADNGIGIEKADQSHIFDIFYRGHSATAKHGSGVGLSFTNILVENLRGTIKVESQPGKGSLFTISIPAHNDSSCAEILPWLPVSDDIVIPVPVRSDDTEASTELTVSDHCMRDDRPTILLVEDNKDIKLLVKLLLCDRYNVLSAANGKEGIDIATEYIPDIVITDIMMPIMDGIEMTMRMKQSPLLCHIPIVALTAKSTEQDRLEGIKSGVVSYLCKPFSPEELLAHIEQLLNDREALKKFYMQKLMADRKPEEEPQPVDDSSMQFLVAAKDAVSNGIKQNPDFSAQDLAEKMCMSSSQLNRKLTSIVGCSAIGYIQQVKIKLACKLLADESKSISDIATEAGFSDPAYFSRTFKRYMNCSPSQYRQQLMAMPKSNTETT
ncbi:ATP-binding protein [Porphyromonas gulae]|uniref:hybrid sensor histidine kinase/response regulator transcription factor n=1 Tax=Porphyromonas gulae TaxID=111105 RepID=UPI0026EC2A13|nr:ATP-binding protein [Porphyromonas gulae]